MKFVIFAVLAFASLYVAESSNQFVSNVGELSPLHPANRRFQATIEVVQADLRSKVAAITGYESRNLVAKSYRYQIVNGVNYFVKFQHGDLYQYFHARIHKDINDKFTVVKVVGPHRDNDPIDYIEV